MIAVTLDGTGLGSDRKFCCGLENKGMRVYTHEQVPCGDGGISLGQAVAAAANVLKGTEQ
ncbi:MAG: hypothetical protein U9P10_01920 [Thermodesulfobacteriota bacterium]|nr:hypothetical protein [Thermodesulfobacteriota bacterium]